MTNLPRGFLHIKTGMVFKRGGEYWEITEFLSLPPRVACVDFKTGCKESSFPLDEILVDDIKEFLATGAMII